MFNKEKFMEFVIPPDKINLFNPINIEYIKFNNKDYLYLNGIHDSDLTNHEKKIIIHKLMFWYRNNLDELNDLLRYFAKTYSTEIIFDKSLEGEDIQTYKFEL